MSSTTDTSRAAYDSIQKEAGFWCERVLEVIASEEGVTGREIAMRLHKESGFVSARLAELHSDRKIARVGKRKDRWTNIEAYTWVVAKAGKPSFGGFRKWLHAQGVGNQSFTPSRTSALYQDYVRSL